VSDRERWTRRVVFAALVVGVLIAFARVEHTTPLLIPMVLLVGAVVAVGGLVADSGGADPPDWGTANVRMIENHLNARSQDPLLRERLARLTDDRLRRLGLQRSDPGVFQRLGPTLTDVLDGPPRRLQPAEIEECIRRIEELSP
jgi:hypothetical protein